MVRAKLTRHIDTLYEVHKEGRKIGTYQELSDAWEFRSRLAGSYVLKITTDKVDAVLKRK
jgi:hypothetical protein